MMARTSRSASASSRARCSSAVICWLMALSASGRLSVIVAIGLVFSYRIVSYAMALPSGFDQPVHRDGAPALLEDHERVDVERAQRRGAGLGQARHPDERVGQRADVGGRAPACATQERDAAQLG